MEVSTIVRTARSLTIASLIERQKERETHTHTLSLSLTAQVQISDDRVEMLLFPIICDGEVIVWQVDGWSPLRDRQCAPSSLARSQLMWR